jgi:DNA mismatch repair protein MutS2
MKTLEGPLRLGDRVHVRTLKKDGVVTALGENDAEVQIGSLRVRARLGELQHTSEGLSAAEGPQAINLDPSSAVHAPSSVIHGPSPGMELDLRGQLADDALDMLDRYLEQAYLSGMPFVRIIHGKGTGRLRQVVRKALKAHPHVASFEEGDPREGGEGVTVAKMVGV